MSQNEVKVFDELPAAITGEPRDLLSCVGNSEALPGISSVVANPRFKPVRDLASLDEFLGEYIGQILVPIELPAVLSAWQFTEHSQVRELIELDADLSRDEALGQFRAASCAVGRRQLSKLRPLRDHRVIQRYWQAMEEGRAAAWHTLVYGILTSTYSLPLRQSLTHLSQQTLGGFALSATVDHQFRLDDCRRILCGHCDGLGSSINSLVESTGPALVIAR
ncbi:MAG: urease accessory UreF family protein [Limisphaerales bacterium]